MGTDHEKAAELRISLLAILPRLSFRPMSSAAAPDLSRPPAAGRIEERYVCHGCGDSACSDRADSRNCLQASAQFIRAMPGMNLAIHLADLLVHFPQLPDQRKKRRLRKRRDEIVIIIFNQRDPIPTPATPWRVTMPNSARWPRKAFTSIVRCRIKSSRPRCSISTLCCSSLFTGTKRIVDRATASQIASASVALFFCRFTYGLT